MIATKAAKRLRRMAKGKAKRRSYTLKELQTTSQILDMSKNTKVDIGGGKAIPGREFLLKTTGIESAFDVIKRKRHLKKWAYKLK